MRISDWSSDVCSSDLLGERLLDLAESAALEEGAARQAQGTRLVFGLDRGNQGGGVIGQQPLRERKGRLAQAVPREVADHLDQRHQALRLARRVIIADRQPVGRAGLGMRSEEHTSELQSLMRISYAVF